MTNTSSTAELEPGGQETKAFTRSRNDTQRGGNSRLPAAFLVLALVLATLSSMSSRMIYAAFDAKGTTVVAQNFLRHGSFTLGQSEAAFFQNKDGDYTYQVFRSHGRFEYYFPPGSVIWAVPVVWLGNFMGADALLHDIQFQAIMVLLCVGSILTITYRLARLYFSQALSAAFAGLIFFGSIVAPTMSGAYWSIDPEIVLTGLILLNLRTKTPAKPALRGAVIGCLLFAGFLTRPTLASFVLCVLVYLAIADRRVLRVAAPVSAALLVAFVGFSEIHFGSYLPPYYLATRLSFQNAWVALAGLLISPSRSVLIYTPVLLALPFLVRDAFRRGNRAWAGMMTAAIGFQFTGNVLFPHWTGGYSFGPRILATMSFMGCVFVVDCVGNLPGAKRSRAFVMVGCLFALGLMVDITGLTNSYTEKWNDYPPIDQVEAAVFDWRYPQILTTDAISLAAKCRAQAPALPPGQAARCP